MMETKKEYTHEMKPEERGKTWKRMGKCLKCDKELTEFIDSDIWCYNRCDPDVSYHIYHVGFRNDKPTYRCGNCATARDKREAEKGL